jgi:hypothetical protein
MFVSTLNYENYLADLVLRLASKEKKINRSRHKIQWRSQSLKMGGSLSDICDRGAGGAKRPR